MRPAQQMEYPSDVPSQAADNPGLSIEETFNQSQAFWDGRNSGND